ncbi:MAG TPA: hypothetical protein DDX91_01750 [Ruminococcaceae bacterium]|nr:hypothetical protein [Oscillospiraceae bacterium]
MIAKTQEGLIGANNAMNVIRTPMKVFYEARARGDKATMDRAMGYAGEINEDAWKHKYSTDEALKEEAEENNAKAEKEAEALAQRIEENRDKPEERIEEGRSDGLQTVTGVKTEENGDGVSDECKSTNSAEKIGTGENCSGTEPITYDESGRISSLETDVQFNVVV